MGLALASGRVSGRTRSKISNLDPAEIAAMAVRFSDWFEDEKLRDRLPAAEKQRLAELWRSQGRNWPAYLRAMFLTTPQAEIALGHDFCSRALSKLKTEEKKRSLSAPSAAWVDAWGFTGEELPHQDGRQHAVRMKRRREVRDAAGNVIRPAGRWTPPQAFADEMECDARSTDPWEHPWYEDMRSPSAAVIAEIAMRRAQERDRGREHLIGISTIEPRRSQ